MFAYCASSEIFLACRTHSGRLLTSMPCCSRTFPLITYLNAVLLSYFPPDLCEGHYVADWHQQAEAAQKAAFPDLRTYVKRKCNIGASQCTRYVHECIFGNIVAVCTVEVAIC